MNSKTIEIDVRLLKKYRLSPTDYIALILLDRGLSKGKIDEVIEGTINWKSIMDRGWVDDATRLCPKYSTSFRPSIDIDMMFVKFYNAFPHTVEGRPPLRTVNPYSRAAKATKERFIREVGIRNAPTRFKEIMRGLKNELEYRRISGESKYMQNIDTWLNQHTYERWLSLPEKKSNSLKYGHNLK